jgi:hypothetical protein
MKSSFHNPNPFLPLFCSCQFRRLDAIQFLCSQAHILAGWRLETRLFTSRLLLLYLVVKIKVKVRVTLRLAVYRQSVCLGVKSLETARYGQHKKQNFYCWRGVFIAPLPSNWHSIVQRLASSGMCSESRCITMSIYVTIFLQGLRKSKNNLIQDSMRPCRYSNTTPTNVSPQRYG